MPSCYLTLGGRSTIYSNYYYPDSYDSEVGVFSSADGVTDWQYHGIVVHRGPAGAWDAGGIASPGVTVAADGTVLLGYAAEPKDGGAGNRGIGVATASHPLGPFTKEEQPAALAICGGTGRCDDVIMQAAVGRTGSASDTVHLYHSLKGSSTIAGCAPPVARNCIRHLTSIDNGATWEDQGVVLSRNGTMETIAGKWFPASHSGTGVDVGRMVLVTDGGGEPGEPNGGLTPFYSEDFHMFAATDPAVVTAHPPLGKRPGDWANLQIAFLPDREGRVRHISYTLYTKQQVYSAHHKSMDRGYTHTVYSLSLAV